MNARSLLLAVAVVGAWVAVAAETPPAPAPKPPPKPAVAVTDPMEIQLPDMQFRQATVAEIIDWIQARSVEADPAGVGANLLFKDDPKRPVGTTRLTLSLARPTVRRALDLLASVATLHVRQDARVIVITPSQTVIGR
ncbi:MAG: hypothetical protein BWK77_01970 [Verrucomicrobia bacterium A1]|nr:MAG: hypothetical protein BWK77_01970 [Verrucomicrobia bacterium A1]